MKSRLVLVLSVLSLSVTLGAAALGCEDKPSVESADAAPTPVTPKAATSAVPATADASPPSAPVPSAAEATDGGKVVDASAKAAPAKK